MGLLNMNNNEHILHEKYIAESARLHGRVAKLYQIKNSEEDIYKDPDIKYKPPVDINILFEDNPTPKLKSLGWYLEGEANPYLAIITNYSDDNTNVDDIADRVFIQRYCKVTLDSYSTVDSDEYTREFKVTEVQGNSIDPIYWTCKLVPWRDNYDFDKSTPERDKTIDSKPNNATGRSYINKEI